MADERVTDTATPPLDPPGVTVALIAMGVAGISFSGPIVVALTIPALAVAFWRNAFGALISIVYVAARGRSELAGLLRADRHRIGLAVAAGTALAVHFALWIPSLRLTSVTASTALVTMTPVWTVVLDKVRRRPVPRGVLAGVLIALTGTLLVTGVDAGRSGRAATGDLLALAGGMAAAAYMSFGESARREMSTAAYTTTAYSICALGLLAVCAVGRQPVAGRSYDARAWVLLLLLTLCAQLIGHTLLNRALAVAGATTVTLAILLETPGAAVVAWVWLGQRPPALIVPGAALVLVGIALVVVSRRVSNVTMTEPPLPG